MPVFRGGGMEKWGNGEMGNGMRAGSMSRSPFGCGRWLLRALGLCPEALEEDAIGLLHARGDLGHVAHCGLRRGAGDTAPAGDRKVAEAEAGRAKRPLRGRCDLRRAGRLRAVAERSGVARDHQAHGAVDRAGVPAEPIAETDPMAETGAGTETDPTAETEPFTPTGPIR